MKDEFQDQGQIDQDLEEWLSPRGIQSVHGFFSEEEKQESIRIEYSAPEGAITRWVRAGGFDRRSLEFTSHSASSLNNPPHKGEYLSFPDPSTLSDHLTTTIVDVSPSGAWLIIIAPSGAEYSILVDSCFSSLGKKP